MMNLKPISNEFVRQIGQFMVYSVENSNMHTDCKMTFNLDEISNEKQIEELFHSILMNVDFLKEAYYSNLELFKSLVTMCVAAQVDHTNVSYFLIFWTEHDPTNQTLVKAIKRYLAYSKRNNKKLLSSLLNRFVLFMPRALSMMKIEENLYMITKIIKVVQEENLFEDPVFVQSFTDYFGAVLFDQSASYTLQHTLFADAVYKDVFVFAEVRETLDWFSVKVAQVLIENNLFIQMVAHKYSNFPAQKMLWKLLALYKQSYKAEIITLIKLAIKQLLNVKNHLCENNTDDKNREIENNVSNNGLLCKYSSNLKKCDWIDVKLISSFKFICKVWTESDLNSIEYMMKPYKYVIPTTPNLHQCLDNISHAYQVNNRLPRQPLLNVALSPLDRFLIIKLDGLDSLMTGLTYNDWKSLRQSDIFSQVFKEVQSLNNNTTISANPENRMNRTLQPQQPQGHVYLYFSMRYSSKFQGVACMTSDVDSHGVFQLQWLDLKDVPNSSFKHLLIEINFNGASDYREVFASPDGQEIDFETGQQMWSIFRDYKSNSSVLSYYKNTGYWY